MTLAKVILSDSEAVECHNQLYESQQDWHLTLGQYARMHSDERACMPAYACSLLGAAAFDYITCTLPCAPREQRIADNNTEKKSGPTASSICTAKSHAGEP